MYTDMEKWAETRHRVLQREISKRADCQEYQIHWETLQKKGHVEQRLLNFAPSNY